MKFMAFIIIFGLTTVYGQNILKAQEKEKANVTLAEQEIALEEGKYNKVKMKSNKGTELFSKILYPGLIKKLAKGEKFIHSYTSSGKPVIAQNWHRSPPSLTTEIPLINGYKFGVMIALDDLPNGENVFLKVVDTIPEPIEFEGKKENKLTQIYNLPKSNKMFYLLTLLNKEEKGTFKTGVWKKEIFNNDELIYSVEFNIVEPSEEEFKLNEEYEKMMADKISASKNNTPPQNNQENNK